jgi:hypothetical protein
VAISAKKARWFEVVSPVALHIIDAINLLRTDQEREQYACWLMLLADSMPSGRVAAAVKYNWTIGGFLADHEEAIMAAHLEAA